MNITHLISYATKSLCCVALGFWSGCSPSSEEQQQTAQLPQAHALLATDFMSLADFQLVVALRYRKTKDSTHGTVDLEYKNNGQTISSSLSDGVTQGDISDARDGSIWDKVRLICSSPYAVWNRKKLSQIYMLARHRPALFGKNDAAFYDLAQSTMRQIVVTDGAFTNFRDSLEKGYINTFNHITAQALITALYDEKIANYVATVHERHHMPQLVSGLFSKVQLKDTLNFPVDNYVDIINNELGQELGKFLKAELNITKTTQWTPQLTAAFLNALHEYYAASFQLTLIPYTAQDPIIIRFSDKLQTIQKGKSYI
ncbi:hypothetical protein N9772_05215 [Bacteroidia bacterium]|nr:hypothetical protein [Bacteroidia bacterium]